MEEQKENAETVEWSVSVCLCVRRLNGKWIEYKWICVVEVHWKKNFD